MSVSPRVHKLAAGIGFGILPQLKLQAHGGLIIKTTAKTSGQVADPLKLLGLIPPWFLVCRN